MITSKTKELVRFRGPGKSEFLIWASEYGLLVTVTDPDGLVVSYPLSPSDTEILHQFLGETLPMWDKDEI